MKNFLTTLGVLAVVGLFCTNAWSGSMDLEIHCVAKRTDQNVKQASDGGAAVTKEHWVYEVTIENKTFRPLSDLELKYLIFLTKEKLGVKAGAASNRQNGSVTVGSLQPHEKKTVTTEAVELSKAHLVGNWIYSSGAKPNANDSLVGVWVRVMQNGQQFAEYANPSTLLKEQWQ
jgi:hypothetical protein